MGPIRVICDYVDLIPVFTANVEKHRWYQMTKCTFTSSSNRMNSACFAGTLKSEAMSLDTTWQAYMPGLHARPTTGLHARPSTGLHDRPTCQAYYRPTWQAYMPGLLQAYMPAAQWFGSTATCIFCSYRLFGLIGKLCTALTVCCGMRPASGTITDTR